MDETLVLVALAPFYVMGVAGAGFALAYTVRSFMHSAVETQMTETLQTPK